ncbi:c-type cytochrome [Sedimenticola sp.]|uniref:c-type cytochrome n=1 Tax=Sedimenticola sp. TaxID=1940285 RepID=UPI003D13444C
MFNKICLLLLLVISQTISAETGRAPTADQVNAGKVLYQRYCVACHGENGVGEAPIPDTIRAPGYFTAMPLDEQSHAWHHSDEQLQETILQGLQRTQRMPAWKAVITPDQAALLVAYIKSLWSPRIVACQGPRHMSCM